MSPGRRVWDEVADLGGEVDALYWSQVVVLERDLESEDLARAVRRLLDHDRPKAALDALRAARAALPGRLLVDLLEALAVRLNAARPDEARPPFWEVEAVFDALDRCGDVPEEEIVQLEWTYFPLLERSGRGPKALRRALRVNPRTYVDLLIARYPPEQPERDDDRFTTLNERSKGILVDLAGRVLRWFSLFGAGTDVAADAASGLEAWVAEVRAGAAAASRAKIADFELGRLLARAPEDGDGVWPVRPVRDLAEGAWTDDLARGLWIGLRNKRGVTTRAIEEGGEQERALAARYQDWGDRLAAGGWFRLASTLHAIGADYGRDARNEDQAAERRRRRP